MRKIIVALVVFFVVFVGLSFYNSQRTVECWWGVMYPTLSYIGIDDETETVKTDSAIFKWFKRFVGRSEEENEQKIIYSGHTFWS